ARQVRASPTGGTRRAAWIGRAPRAPKWLALIPYIQNYRNKLSLSIPGRLLVRNMNATNSRQLPLILALGTTQTVAWAFSYYLPAIMADPIARDLGVSSNWIFAAFSASLVISALLGPRIGRQIDLVGGRPVLSFSNVTLAGGLALLGCAHSIPVLMIAWLL